MGTFALNHLPAVPYTSHPTQQTQEALWMCHPWALGPHSPLARTVCSSHTSYWSGFAYLENQRREYCRGSPEALALASGSYPGPAWQNGLWYGPKVWVTSPLLCSIPETGWFWDYRHAAVPSWQVLFFSWFLIEKIWSFGLVYREWSFECVWICVGSTCRARTLTP